MKREKKWLVNIPLVDQLTNFPWEEQQVSLKEERKVSAKHSFSVLLSLECPPRVYFHSCESPRKLFGWLDDCLVLRSLLPQGVATHSLTHSLTLSSHDFVSIFHSICTVITRVKKLLNPKDGLLYYAARTLCQVFFPVDDFLFLFLVVVIMCSIFFFSLSPF